jgi:hypothetical protein
MKPKTTVIIVIIALVLVILLLVFIRDTEGHNGRLMTRQEQIETMKGCLEDTEKVMEGRGWWKGERSLEMAIAFFYYRTGVPMPGG